MTDNRKGRGPLEARILELMVERLQVEVPSVDLDLFGTGVVDSLMLVKLLASLEERFGIHVAVEELEMDNFRTVRQIAAFVEVKQVALGNPRRVGAAS
ncbi:MAG TPA: acyl carrier protein [Gemmatimonadales bacterium]|nr:acyl carrier protein [Gemmatimonadales bacterium]